MDEWGIGKAEEKPTSVTSESKPEAKPPTSVHHKRGFVTLLYGDTATGKTFTALSFPSPIYIIDTENRAINTKHAVYHDKEIHIYEPVELKTEIDESMDDIFDEVASINNLTNYLSKYVSDVKSGKIKGGTLVIDSVSDVWTWIQAWGFDRLSKMRMKDGRAKADEDMMTVVDQRDWKLMNTKHASIVLVLRSLTREGIHVVFTAKEKSVPEYATARPQNKEKIRCQKEIPFASDIIINLRRQDAKYLAVIEKLGVKKPPLVAIEEITFEKLHELKPLG